MKKEVLNELKKEIKWKDKAIVFVMANILSKRYNTKKIIIITILKINLIDGYTFLESVKLINNYYRNIKNK